MITGREGGWVGGREGRVPKWMEEECPTCVQVRCLVCMLFFVIVSWCTLERAVMRGQTEGGLQKSAAVWCGAAVSAKGELEVRPVRAEGPLAPGSLLGTHEQLLFAARSYHFLMFEKKSVPSCLCMQGVLSKIGKFMCQACLHNSRREPLVCLMLPYALCVFWVLIKSITKKTPRLISLFIHTKFPGCFRALFTPAAFSDHLI